MNQILNYNKKSKVDSNKNHSSLNHPIIGRRPFLRSMGIAVVAIQMGMLNLASSLFAEPKNSGKPSVRVAFVRPDVDRYFMGWPGADWDNPEHQKHYTDILIRAGKNMNVDVRFTQELLDNEEVVGKFLEDVKNEQPDGLLL